MLVVLQIILLLVYAVYHDVTIYPFNQDADECEVTCLGRDTICHNTFGSFDCNCQEGFIWGGNGVDCEGMYYMVFSLIVYLHTSVLKGRSSNRHE